ncbi:MAG: hypothetical protein AB7F25_12435 [Deferribacterales bacterium]
MYIAIKHINHDGKKYQPGAALPEMSAEDIDRLKGHKAIKEVAEATVSATTEKKSVFETITDETALTEALLKKLTNDELVKLCDARGVGHSECSKKADYIEALLSPEE